MPPILNVADATPQGMDHAPAFAFTMRPLAQALGAQRVGANVTSVPPGKAAFPLHHHFGQEEHFFILSGSGLLRFGAESHSVKPQDYIVCPCGGPEVAHQLINTGDEELVYLAISNIAVPEVVGYPDSGKTGVMSAPWGLEPRPFIMEDAARNAVDYWAGEDGAAVEAAVSTAEAGQKGG